MKPEEGCVYTGAGSDIIVEIVHIYGQDEKNTEALIRIVGKHTRTLFEEKTYKLQHASIDHWVKIGNLSKN